MKKKSKNRLEFLKYVDKKIVIRNSIVLIVGIGLIFLINIYLGYIDKEANRVMEGTDTSLTVISNKKTDNDFNYLDLENDIKEYIKKKKGINKVTYKIENETFHFVISIEDDGYTIEKIIDSDHNINAITNYKGIKSIAYKTDTMTETTVINLISNDKTNYYAIANNSSYFLGSDVDEIVYKEDRFFYRTYNQKYISLKGIAECTSAEKKKIDDYKTSDNIYKEGKINFLKDFYQKIDAKNYTVKEYCNSLKIS